ncbi:MAG: rod-binding protein [Spirochaetaceae bacterium]|jgi:flagellar protein FlgJ|nr:rod-binding protein [Spirochaetaceae bacterium]
MESLAARHFDTGGFSAQDALFKRLSAGSAPEGVAAAHSPAGDGGGQDSFAAMLAAASKPAAADAPEGAGGTGGGGQGAASAGKPVIDKSSKLYEQCAALEGFLLKTLINGMRKTVEKSEFTKGGFAGEMYEDMLYDEYTANFSRNANFGLAGLAYLELSGQRGKLLSGGPR